MKARIASALAACAVLAAPVTHADLGGTVNGPGLCDYPSTGFSIGIEPIVGQVAVFYCRWPQEINGSYWVQVYGLYTTSGNAHLGPNLALHFGLGGGGGVTGFYCLADPDNALAFPDPARTQKAADPEGIGAWKNDIHDKRTACKPKSAAPPAEHAPVPPAPELETGAPTNPAGADPVQTQNNEGRG